MTARTGLVLTGGGARGAYQAGAVLALSELFGDRGMPFPIISGVSAGAISCAFLASGASTFRASALKLADLWRRMKPEDVFITDPAVMTCVGIRWVADLALGGWIGAGRGRSLLITAPLRRLLEAHIDSRAIAAHIDAGLLQGVAVTATNSHTGTAVTFFDGLPSIEPWVRTTRMAVRTPLTVDHVMASAAIPLFFPATRINGGYYLDGCVRMSTPLSPALHMGADRVIAIGIRHYREPQHVSRLNATLHHTYPSVAETAGLLLNAIFLDALEADVERMERINRTVQRIPPAVPGTEPHRLRNVPVLTLQPSQDLGAMVVKTLDRFPRMVRHLLRGLGASEENGWDLLSYLAFDSAYTARILELGYQDVMHRRTELEAFMGLQGDVAPVSI